MNHYQFLEFLERHGYEKLGRGCNASVWAKPGSSKVIKVGNTCDSWLGYIVWAMSKGYVGNHAPRVDSFKVNKDYFVAVMERLHCIGSKNRELMRKVTPDTNMISENIPEWKTFGKEFMAQFGYNNDLHNENWMQRSNGELVLTDPIHGKPQQSFNRHKSRPRSTSSLRDDPN